jgi:hypothetical protein
VARKLLQVNARCPDGCETGSCQETGTGAAGGYVCSSCRNTLMVSRVTGQCVCPPGKYSAAPDSCTGEVVCAHSWLLLQGACQHRVPLTDTAVLPLPHGNCPANTHAHRLPQGTLL